MEKILKVNEHKYQIYLTEDEIQQRVKELGKQISSDYEGTIPIFVGVLNGSFLFIADLLKNIEIDCEIDFIRVSSYGDGMVSSGYVNIKKDFSAELHGRDIIMVEDIVDSGKSVQFLLEYVGKQKPKSIKFVSLLRKKDSAKVDVDIDYIGFEIDNKFVIGYGLDYAQLKRNLRNIYQVIEE